jgi:predicted RNA-binding protein with PIN domain
MTYTAYALRPRNATMTRIRKDEIIAESQPISHTELEHLRTNATCVATSEYDEQYSVFDRTLNRHIHITVYLTRTP